MDFKKEQRIVLEYYATGQGPFLKKSKTWKSDITASKEHAKYIIHFKLLHWLLADIPLKLGVSCFSFPNP